MNPKLLNHKPQSHRNRPISFRKISITKCFCGSKTHRQPVDHSRISYSSVTSHHYAIQPRHHQGAQHTSSQKLFYSKHVSLSFFCDTFFGTVCLICCSDNETRERRFLANRTVSRPNRILQWANNAFMQLCFELYASECVKNWQKCIHKPWFWTYLG